MICVICSCILIVACLIILTLAAYIDVSGPRFDLLAYQRIWVDGYRPIDGRLV